MTFDIKFDYEETQRNKEEPILHKYVFSSHQFGTVGAAQFDKEKALNQALEMLIRAIRASLNEK